MLPVSCSHSTLTALLPPARSLVMTLDCTFTWNTVAQQSAFLVHTAAVRCLSNVPTNALSPLLNVEAVCGCRHGCPGKMLHRCASSVGSDDQEEARAVATAAAAATAALDVVFPEGARRRTSFTQPCILLQRIVMLYTLQMFCWVQPLLCCILSEQPETSRLPCRTSAELAALQERSSGAF